MLSHQVALSVIALQAYLDPPVHLEGIVVDLDQLGPCMAAFLKSKLCRHAAPPFPSGVQAGPTGWRPPPDVFVFTKLHCASHTPAPPVGQSGICLYM